MSASWWVGNLLAYSVQVALLVAVGGLAAAALRLKQPRVMLAYWQALLAACLLLPLLEPWQRMGFAPAGGVATIIATKAGGADSLLSSFPLHAWVLAVLVAGVGLLRLAWGFGVSAITGAPYRSLAGRASRGAGARKCHTRVLFL